uniref:Uncharacterized protein n=1 Tax=Panagrolaimus superbus TaxID=310955 RepID=A0A914XU04_9BILA
MIFVIKCKYHPLTAEKIVKEKFREICEKYDIFWHFPSEEIIMLNGTLFNLKPNVKEGECIAVMVAGLHVPCRIVKRVGKYFSMVDSYDFTIPELSNSKHTISIKHKLKHVIFVNYSTDGKYFKDFGLVDSIDKIRKAFSGVEVSFLEKNIHDAGVDAMPGMIRYLMDGKEPEYMTRYFCETEFTLSSLIKCKNGDPLPFDKTVIYDVKKNNFITLCETKSGCIKRIDLNKYNAAKVKITFELDIDMFYNLQIEPIGPTLPQEPLERTLKEKLNIQLNDKAKIVFTQNYFSLFILKKGKKKVVCLPVSIFIIFVIP